MEGRSVLAHIRDATLTGRNYYTSPLGRADGRRARHVAQAVKCTNPKCKDGEKGTAYTGARGYDLDAPCPRYGKYTIKVVLLAKRRTARKNGQKAA